jgi:hypothetical protein
MYTVKIAKTWKLRITFGISQKKVQGFYFYRLTKKKKIPFSVFFPRIQICIANLPIAMKNYMQSCKCHSFFDVCACKARKPQTRAL